MTKQTIQTKRLLRRHLRRPREKRTRKPQLKFSPTAWAKLLFLRDAGPTEVGGFGISDAEDLLSVQDIQLVRQHCTETFVSFDDAAVADFFDEQVDLDRQPEQFGRIWIHTHPGNSAQPSSTDLQTFDRCFGSCDWAVMFILAQGGATHAELHWRSGNARLPMNVSIEFAQGFEGSDFELWQEEYDHNVVRQDWAVQRRPQDDAFGGKNPFEDFDLLLEDPFLEPATLERRIAHEL